MQNIWASQKMKYFRINLNSDESINIILDCVFNTSDCLLLVKVKKIPTQPDCRHLDLK